MGAKKNCAEEIRADMEALIRATDEILREAGHEKGND